MITIYEVEKMKDKNKGFSSPPLGGGRVGLQFKQAWNLLKQERLFNSIYIIGTALSITMVMVISIVYYIRIANIYPETNRDRMLVVQSAMVRSGDGSMHASSLSLPTIKKLFQ
ncbi:MAG: hypothetical protein LUH15_09810 [Tannerellaceae bacterium]|nr:hypothetical protein [Tannerellaceae bacterium]